MTGQNEKSPPNLPLTVTSTDLPTTTQSGDVAGDEIFCYGATCTWAGPISKAGNLPNHTDIPGCPYCHGPLWQFDRPERWWQGRWQAMSWASTPGLTSIRTRDSRPCSGGPMTSPSAGAIQSNSLQPIMSQSP
jgi:hypothetical protein